MCVSAQLLDFKRARVPPPPPPRRHRRRKMFGLKGGDMLKYDFLLVIGTNEEKCQQYYNTAMKFIM